MDICDFLDICDTSRIDVAFFTSDGVYICTVLSTDTSYPWDSEFTEYICNTYIKRIDIVNTKLIEVYLTVFDEDFVFNGLYEYIHDDNPLGYQVKED